MRTILIAAAVAGGAGGRHGWRRRRTPRRNAWAATTWRRRRSGPSFKDAAAKNKGNKDAAGAIVAKMKDGKGHPKVAGYGR